MRWLAAVLLAPFAIVVALIVRLFGPGAKDRSAEEVARYIRNLIDDTGGEWDWDDFESVPIRDPDLDRIRQEAALAGPPDPDFDRLADLLRQAEARAAKAV